MNKLLCMILVMTFPLTSIAEWKFKTSKDSMTDKTIVEAKVVNKYGDSFTLYRENKGEVWANFQISGSNADVMSSTYPIYRVDKQEAVDMDKLHQLDEMLIGLRAQLGKNSPPEFNQKPKWVNWKVGDESIKEIKKGNVILFRYYLFTGGSKETSFSLTGATKAINQVLR